MQSPLDFRVPLNFVITLFPLALYCMVLAGINRRDRPTLVRGAWDFIGMLAGASGILLWTGPVLLMQLNQRAITENLAAPTPRTFDDLWSRWWLIWACYYALIILGAALLLYLRSSVTAIYNVDVDRLPGLLRQALQRLGLETASHHDHQVLIAPAKEPAGDGPPTFSAAVDIDAFPSLCHATLHWYTSDARLRRDVERELSKQLKDACPADNPATLWFFGASTLLFSAIVLAVVVFILAGMFPRRW